ncbi:MAG TPA: TIGR02587 family membrane protein [Blastocatellia bacterium]|jgi:putative integral membrane protein (TIGR02587 family)|nr:TIGR02587 family membrane protein [Blastocatellia bacterium]
MSKSEAVSDWHRELNDLMRAVAGAFLFGAPFLYTMEVWWKGNFTSPPRMLFALAAAYVSLVALNLNGGFRTRQPRAWNRILGDSAEGLAVALASAAFSLVLIGIIRFNEGLEVIMGRIVMEAVPFSIGVGIASNFLKKQDEEGGGGSDGLPEERAQDWSSDAWRGTLADAGSTVLGATIICSSIAPTDEIPMIAAGLSSPWLLVMIGASLLLSYIIVFEADLGSQSRRMTQTGIFQSPISETLASYLLSLLVAFLTMWLFQLVRVDDPLSQWVNYTIVLGLPATIGGAAGRVAL